MKKLYLLLIISQFTSILGYGQSLYTSYLNKKVTVDVSNFPKGVYIIKINNDKECVVKKFIIQ